MYKHHLSSVHASEKEAALKASSFRNLCSQNKRQSHETSRRHTGISVNTATAALEVKHRTETTAKPATFI